MSESPADRTNPVDLPRRGPYGPARAFVSKGQPLVWVEAHESLLSAMDRLSGEGFSQAPVRKNGQCVGMLELFGLLQALLERTEFRELAGRLNVGDFTSSARFVDAGDWIDQSFDWLADVAGVVGTASAVEGIITPSDVLRRVNDYTEAFSVFAELEGICRALFAGAFPLEQEEERGRLHALFRDRSGKRDSTDVFLPMRIDELGFWHYWAVFTDAGMFARIEPYCYWSRIKFANELDRARLLRNDVMHFKRQAEPREVERLRILRDQLGAIERGWIRAHAAPSGAGIDRDRASVD